VRPVFKGSFSDAPDQVDYVANVDDLQILNGAGPSKLAALHAANAADLVYTYQKIAGLHGPGPTSPSGDPGWQAVVSQNLLWHDSRGHPVTEPLSGWYYVDILTPSKRAAWTRVLLANVQDQLANGYDAVFLDDANVIDPSLISEYPPTYSDAAYYEAVGQVLASVRAALPGRKIIVNSYTGAAAPGNRGLELLADCDGLFFEAFSYRNSGEFFDPARYLQQVDDFAAVVASGKMAVAMDYAPATDMPHRMWSLASYLLVDSERSYHYFAATDSASDLQSYPENALAIGVALGDAAASTDGLVRRVYRGATAIVNPSPRTVDYSLSDDAWEQLELGGGGAFPDMGTLSWLPIASSSISLAPDTAAILRHQ